MFSFAGDTVVDPFAGTGTTALAAVELARNSISVEIEPSYVGLIGQRLSGAKSRLAKVRVHRGPAEGKGSDARRA